MEIYLPKSTTDDSENLQQAFLTQVFLPQISAKGNSLYKFHKDFYNLYEQNGYSPEMKTLYFDPGYECEFENYVRATKKEDFVKHLEFIENIEPKQLAVLSPFARFYVGKPNDFLKDKKSAIPIYFDKRFDSDYFVKNTKNSRGEAAGLINIRINRQYNITGDYDPITIKASFFFSSYEVLVHKPAVRKENIIDLLSSNQTEIFYTELLKRRKEFDLILEYGWNVNDGVAEDILSREQKEIINKHEKSYLKLSAKEHNLNFNEDGSLTVDVDYVVVPLQQLKQANKWKDGLFLYKSKKDKFDKNEKEISDLKNKLNKQRKELEKNNKTLKNQTDPEAIDDLKEDIGKNRETIKGFIKEIEKKKNFYAKQFLSFLDNEGKKREYKIKIEKIDPNKPDRSVSFELNYGLSKFTKSIIYNPNTFYEGNEQKIKDLFDTNLPETNVKSDPTYFYFFRDIFEAAIKLNSLSDENNKIPTFIISNIPIPLADSRKFWANVGDIPIEEKVLLSILIEYFNTYPNGTLKQFIEFFILRAIPQRVISKSCRTAFPRISYTYFPYKEGKFSFVGDKKDLFDGKEGTLEKLAENSFQDNDISSTQGCFVITQAPGLITENSRFNLASSLELFKESFFKNEKEVRKYGFAKLVIGSPKGVLKRLNFNSNSDPAFTNYFYEANKSKEGVPESLISSNFQYTANAELFGSKVYQFTGFVHIPSYSIGKRTPNVDFERRGLYEQYKKDLNSAQDFALGGLYYILNSTENLDLTKGSYTRNLSMFRQISEANLVLQELTTYEEGNFNKEVLFPSTSLDVSFSKYINVPKIIKKPTTEPALVEFGTKSINKQVLDKLDKNLDSLMNDPKYAEFFKD